MLLHWTYEAATGQNGKIAWLLRDPKGIPYGYVTKRYFGWGFIGILIDPGMPSCGPYSDPAVAAKWVQDAIRRKLFKDASFGKFVVKEGSDEK